MDCSTPGLPIHHHLPEFAQTHIHGVDDAIQPICLPSPPSPPALNLSYHQGLFQNHFSSSVSEDKTPQLHKVTLLVGVAPVGSLPIMSQFLESVLPLDGDICKDIPWRVQRLVISSDNIISERNRVDDTAKKGWAVCEKSSSWCLRAIGSVQGTGQDGPDGPVCPLGLGHCH